MCRNDEDLKSPSLRHSSFPVDAVLIGLPLCLSKEPVSEGAVVKSLSGQCVPGTRTTAIQSYGDGQRLRCHSIRRWPLSVFSIAHRRDAVNGCQWTCPPSLVDGISPQTRKTDPSLTAFSEKLNGETKRKSRMNCSIRYL